MQKGRDSRHFKCHMYKQSPAVHNQFFQAQLQYSITKKINTVYPSKQISQTY